MTGPSSIWEEDFMTSAGLNTARRGDGTRAPAFSTEPLHHSVASEGFEPPKSKTADLQRIDRHHLRSLRPLETSH